MTDSIDVVVDTREPDDTANYFRAHSNVGDVTQSHLDPGDVAIGEVRIERKTSADFHSSLTDDDNRLFDQARRLAEHETTGFIIVTGSFDAMLTPVHSELPPSAICGAMASIMIRTGIPVIPANNPIDATDLAVRLGQKSVDAESSAFDQSGAVSTDLDTTARLYASIEGIGGQRAQTLADVFPTVSEAVTASEEELAQLEGFGPRTAQAVHDGLH